MPIGNDLTDGEGVWETGHRRTIADPCSDDPLLFVSLGRQQQGVVSLWPRVQRGELSLTEADLGVNALSADLGGESTRRFDAMAGGIAGLSRDLDARGVKLALLQYQPSSFGRSLALRLARAGVQAPWIPLLAAIGPEDVLPEDPHPNVRAVRAMALWCADSLLHELRFIEPQSARGDPVAPEYEGRRAPSLAVETLEPDAELDRADDRARLVAAIEPATGRGLYQVYGGLSPAGTVGPRLLAALPRAPGTLEIELAAIEDRPDLLPLTVRVEIDGERVGEVRLELPADPDSARAAARAAIALDPRPLPRADGAASETIDVKLIPDRFAAVRELGGFDLGSCRQVRLALGPR